MTPVDRALAYHRRTKHEPRRFARSLGYLDWETQPNPFRTFAGAPTVPLPLLADGLDTLFGDLDRTGAVAPRACGLPAIGLLFELSLGLSAWKEHAGARWSLRCSPSSGNLHPTEGYAIVPETPGLTAGVYHYMSRDHLLERRCTLSGDALARLLGPGGFLVGLASIHWREAWKYGERAFRYCQHDVGHALAAVRYAAAALGWSAVLLDDLGDAAVAGLLGLDRDEAYAGVAQPDREHPDGLLFVCPAAADAWAQAAAITRAAPELCAIARASAWTGEANALSPRHVEWEVINDVAEATRKPASDAGAPFLPANPVTPLTPRSRVVRTADLIRGRRSAVAFDGETSLDVAALYAMLDRLVPRPRVPPWDALPWAPHLHLVLFVHRVRGLSPGLYVLERNDAVHDRLHAAMRAEFLWTRPPGCPGHLRVFCLMDDVDLRTAAELMSCRQEIASDGFFSLGMIADFDHSIRVRGAPWYRRLFWEAGMLGHVLYLEAEAASRSDALIRATGIGCYLDDTVHDLCGLDGDDFQSLYHFAVGAPVDDPRLSTLPPYAHLDARRRGDHGLGVPPLTGAGRHHCRTS